MKQSHAKAFVIDYGWAAPDLPTQLEAHQFRLTSDWGPPTFEAMRECYKQGIITPVEMQRAIKRFHKKLWRNVQKVY